MRILHLTLAVALASTSVAQIAVFDFNNSPYTSVSSSASGITVSVFDISAGSVQTNITTGTYFSDEPYVQGSSGWAQSTQEAAKNFSFTITADEGYEFSISNVALEAYATGAGPSAIGITINSSSILSQNMPDSSLQNVSQSVTLSGLTSATIYIQGWDNGSRSTSGGGDFRLDNVTISGAVSAVPEPSTYAALAGLAILGFAAYRRRNRNVAALAA